MKQTLRDNFPAPPIGWSYDGRLLSLEDMLDSSIPIEDRIIALCAAKQNAFRNCSAANVFSLQPQLVTDPEYPQDIESVILGASMALKADAKTDKLVLFTSDQRDEAEKFVLNNPDHDLIHTTPMGYYLEKMRLFSDRSFGKVGTEAAYAFWNCAAAKLVSETTSKEVHIFANPENKLSTLWMLEVIALAQEDSPTERFVMHYKDQDKPVILDKEGIKQHINPDLQTWYKALKANDFDPEHPDVAAVTSITRKYIESGGRTPISDELRPYLTTQIEQHLPTFMAS